eukprot:TRINITY_DN2574_c0_g1_i2.p3 TRINITY_DN2574_c0_g1~~TRINITY_DN2574_c0_g1_i2.p3  ORF type:complete len:392 (+),score=126.39 TRINITY_DN2574_c0_g1_i2:27-1178(+)
MIRRPPRSTHCISSAASDVYKRQLIYYLFVPGKVENWVTLIDIGNIGITSIPRTAMKGMIDTLQDCYKGRLCKMFVVNANMIIRVLWGIVEGLMDPNTRNKVSLTSNSTSKEIQDWIYPSQLLKEYGGTADPPPAYWPPVFPPGEFRRDPKADHMTVEEFKEELVKQPLLMPSPQLAPFVRESRKAKAKKGVFPRKTFILPTRIERRDSFNGIVTDTEAKVSTEKAISTINPELQINPASAAQAQSDKLAMEKSKPATLEAPPAAAEAKEQPNKPPQNPASPQMGALTRTEEVEIKVAAESEVPGSGEKMLEEKKEEVVKFKGPEGTASSSKAPESIKQPAPIVSNKTVEIAKVKENDEVVMEKMKPKKVQKEESSGCQCVLL